MHQYERHTTLLKRFNDKKELKQCFLSWIVRKDLYRIFLLKTFLHENVCSLPYTTIFYIKLHFAVSLDTLNVLVSGIPNIPIILLIEYQNLLVKKFSVVFGYRRLISEKSGGSLSPKVKLVIRTRANGVNQYDY